MAKTVKPIIDDLLNKKTENEWQPQYYKDAKYEGWIDFSDGDYEGEAKVYGLPSDYGINGGRVSKLYIKHQGKPILNYDRGWDTRSGELELDPSHQDFYDNLLTFLEHYGSNKR